MMRFIQHGFFIFKVRYLVVLIGWLRRLKYSFLGMGIGAETVIPKIYITLPNAVSIGKKCILEHGIYFKYAGVWIPEKSIIIQDEVFIGWGCEFNISKKLIIGKYSNIASGCKFIDHDHGIKANLRIGPQAPIEKEIILGEDVWLGCNVIVLKGAIIGDGAVVAAGSVVTKTIPANEIWAGVPAKKIGARF